MSSGVETLSLLRVVSSGLKQPLLRGNLMVCLEGEVWS